MKIASWMLEPLHWLKVTVAIVAWLLMAPALWDGMRTVAATPGGGGLLFGAVGLLLVTVIACRRGRSRHAPVAHFPMTVAEMVNQIRRTPEQLEHAARHEAAHAVVAWNGGAHVSSVDVISEGVVGGRCSFRLPDRQLVDSAWLALRVALASTVEDDRTCLRSTGGCSGDITEALTHVAVIIATDQRPEGFEGPLTLEGLVSGATEQARQVLEEHEHLVDAIAAHLVAHQDTHWVDPDVTSLHHELTGSRELVPS